MENDGMPPLEDGVPGSDTWTSIVNNKSTNSVSNGIVKQEKNENAKAEENSDEDDNDMDMEDEEANSNEATICLFCTETKPSIDDAIKHLVDVHNIVLSKLKQKFKMDQYSFIKLINCIRSEGISAQKLAKAETIFWDDIKYLKPGEYEPWLTYDYDELLATDQPAEQETLERTKLLQVIQKQSGLLQRAQVDMDKLRAGLLRLVDIKDEKPAENQLQTQCVANTSLHADDGYFSSYAHFGIHHEMLSDVVRTSSYRDALLNNKLFVTGKTVLDVGCGTAVLSIFAAQAGAKSVVGIDNSEIVYNAMDIVKNNNADNVVTLIKGRLEDTELPEKKYDIIISEWMGYFLLFEGMLDSIIYARQHHLKEGGIILPNRCTLSLLGYGSDELHARHIDFWHNVYGLNMSNMREQVLHEPLVEIVDAAHILTESEMIADFNMSTVELNYSNFTHNFNLKCNKAGNLSAFVGYFDTYFDLPEPVMFGTAPTDKPTHWKQVVFFIEKPQTLNAGDIVKGKIICKKLKNSARSLDIVIEVFQQRFTYYLE